MKTLKEMMSLIELPEEVQEVLMELEPKLQGDEIEDLIIRLTKEDQWRDARMHLKALLEPDERGLKMLLCTLRAAAYSHEKYVANGISEQMFAETMKCFTRFVKEHKVSYGVYGYDRDYWTGRQLSLQEFRIGELEFELLPNDGERKIDIHIPSGAVLSRENCVESVGLAREFFAKYDRRYLDVPYVCCSWLLSPALKEILPEDSKIIQFQEMFQIGKVDKEEQSFREWVYKRKEAPLEKLQEDTSLQRKIKAHLLNGGWIGAAEGILQNL